MRLSRKAQDKASEISAQLEGLVRTIAARLATERGAEFADERDVCKAYETAIRNAAGLLINTPD